MYVWMSAIMKANYETNQDRKLFETRSILFLHEGILSFCTGPVVAAIKKKEQNSIKRIY